MNKRVKHQPEIVLPLQELWKLYMEANATSMVKNFAIVYIEMAFERADRKVCTQSVVYAENLFILNTLVSLK